MWLFINFIVLIDLLVGGINDICSLCCHSVLDINAIADPTIRIEKYECIFEKA